jgi:hypothetical protein
VRSRGALFASVAVVLFATPALRTGKTGAVMRGSEHRHYVAFIGRTRHSVPAVFGYGMNGGQGAARPSKRTLRATKQLQDYLSVC